MYSKNKSRVNFTPLLFFMQDYVLTNLSIMILPHGIRIVLLISFGITTLPRASIRRTIPVVFI